MKRNLPFVKLITISSAILFTIVGCDVPDSTNKHSISNSIPINDVNIPVPQDQEAQAPIVNLGEIETDTEESATIPSLNSTEINIADSYLKVDSAEEPVVSLEESDTKIDSAKVDTAFANPDEAINSENQLSRDQFLAKLIQDNAPIDYTNIKLNLDEKSRVKNYCKKIGARLNSVKYSQCMKSNHKLSPFNSVNGSPIVITEFPPKGNKKPLGRVLIIGGTHGDELTSVSTSYQWINKLNKFHSGLFHWHIAPAINPDSILIKPAKRTNANGIDINRNLPTTDWKKQSALRWSKTGEKPRRNPGLIAASEPETQWIMHEIETFKPDAIVSIHAPYGILDFDSPELKLAPSKFGRLKLNLLGTYPGSLGNYAGIEKGIPVLTLELPNALYMPPQEEIDAIWSDMIRWLRKRLSDKS